MAEPSLFDGASRTNRKALSKAATELYKSGAEPNETPAPERPTRAQRRQALRIMGFRGTKTAKANPERNKRRIARESAEMLKVILVDEQLAAAKARVEHPLISRLRRG